MLLYAIFFINMAFILYTIGVWSEKIQGKLKIWHVIIFWLGFINDTIGTLSMEVIAKQRTGDALNNILDYLPLHMDFHSITGTLALVLMLFHALWATLVLMKKNDAMVGNFHKFSLIVWVIWLIPFITGVIYHTL